MLHEFFDNFRQNLFKPLLLFFYMGFSVPLLGVEFEMPHVLYQGLTIYLLLSIGWHGGEELALLGPEVFGNALGFMVVGLATNAVIGVLAYQILRRTTNLRQVDAATVAGYYGSDSAGTFVTCLGVLTAAGLSYAAYMPVMLAVMEVPGCLIAMYLVARLRARGMDQMGNMPGERGYHPAEPEQERQSDSLEGIVLVETMEEALVGAAADIQARRAAKAPGRGHHGHGHQEDHGHGRGHACDHNHNHNHDDHHHRRFISPRSTKLLQPHDLHELHNAPPRKRRTFAGLSPVMLKEVFLNPGLFLLFGGVLIGFISGLQGESVTGKNDALFINLFQGLLCLFLLEMGHTAAKRLKDLRQAGWRFIAFGLLAPNLFAAIGICSAHLYSSLTGQPLELGTYVLFAVLCGAASYIAVPAIQQMAIPEASATLPLAAALGLTFTYNVTIGIPVYMEMAKAVLNRFPVA